MNNQPTGLRFKNKHNKTKQPNKIEVDIIKRPTTAIAVIYIEINTHTTIQLDFYELNFIRYKDVT